MALVDQYGCCTTTMNDWIPAIAAVASTPCKISLEAEQPAALLAAITWSRQGGASRLDRSGAVPERQWKN